MAIVRAVKSGNWSDPTVWNTGALPTAADDVYSNTFTVTIDTSPTVLSVRNGSATGVTAGGGFAFSASGYTLTAASVVATGANICVNNNVSSGANAIIGDLSCGNGTAGHAVNNASSGTLNVTGNSTGGSASQGAHGVNNASTGTINLTGNSLGGSSASFGANNASTGTLNITGTITGGTASSAYGAQNSSTGTFNHVGTAQASAFTAAIGPGAVGQVTTLTGPLLSTTTAEGTAAASGVNPCIALRWFPRDTALSTFSYTMRGETVSGGIRPARILYLPDAYASGQPTPANVRSGTVYGPGNIYTGACAVPGASSVLSGVAIDNTTGTATISAAGIRAALGLASANLDTQLAPMANLDATVSSRLAASDYTAPPSVGDIATAVWAAATRTLTTAIDNSATIAAAVWSYATGRTITGGTVDTLTNAPDVPTEAEIATAIRSELATELAHLDADVSSRLAPDGTLATVTTLTNAPDVPTAEEIAAEVWTTTERTVTGGTVDSVTNSTPVDAGEIAEAVRAELTPELARVSNAATTQEVADIVEGAAALPET